MNLENKISNGFKTPDDFFETFEKNMIIQLNIQNKVIQINHWKKNKLIYLNIAAAFVITFVIVLFYQNNNTLIDSEAIAYEDVLHQIDWENELTDIEISELKQDILIDETIINEHLLDLEISELN